MISKIFNKITNREIKIGVLSISGIIAANNNNKYVSLASLKPSIDKIIKSKVSFMALVINSPGGSPVQSALIANYIIKKAKKHNITVYSFIEDTGASGGYWIALAGEKIYAMPSSVVGSIGVIAASFGLDEFLNKNNIHRRVYTQGENKNFFDPFSKENPEGVKIIKELQGDIYNQFVNWVIERRADKINTNNKELFTGKIFSGERSKPLGLVDEIGDYLSVINDLYGDKCKIIHPNKKSKKGLLSLINSSSSDRADDLVEALSAKISHIAKYNNMWN